MKKFLIFAVIVGVILYLLLSPGEGGTSIKDYQSSIKSASGNVIELVSGLHVKLIGVESNRTDVEMFIKNGFLGKSVTLIPDSKGDQEITDPNGTIGAYVILMILTNVLITLLSYNILRLIVQWNCRTVQDG